MIAPALWERRALPGSGLFPQCVLVLVCGGYTLGAGLGWGAEQFALVMGDFGLSVAALAAAVSCLRYGRSRRSGQRPAWLLFALSSLMAALGNGVWGWYEVVLHRPVPDPSIADLFFLCFAPPAIIGLLVLAKRPLTKAGWICLGLDASLIGGSLLTLSWSLALARTARVPGQSVQHVALTLAYPLLDIALISMVLVLHFRRTTRNRSAVNTAVGALAVTVLSDALFTSPLLHASYRSGQLLDAGWFAGSLLLAYAPWAGGTKQAGAVHGRRPATAPAAASAVAGALSAPNPLGTPGAGCPLGPAGTAGAPGGPPPAPHAPRMPGDPVTPVAGPPSCAFTGHERYPVNRPTVGSLAALTPYLAAAVCTLGILCNVFDGRSVDRVVLFTACTVVLVLILRQGIMLVDNMALARELAEKENHFRSLVQGSSDVIMIADPDGRLHYVSPAAAGVYGRDPDELTGSDLDALIHPDDLSGVHHEIRRFLAASPRTEPTTRIECRLRSGRGQWLNVESTVSRHEGGLILNSRDVTERVRLQAQLQHNAEHDPLTDLPNRVLFTRRVGRALGGRRTTDRGTAVLFIDLDGFKGINDTIGHQAGDELLVQAARRLREAVRQSDTPARLGGDEFAALVTGDGTPGGTAREQHIYELADRLRTALSRPYTVDGHDVRVGASIGAAFAEPGISAGELLRNADQAMYRAKKGGKGRVVLYGSHMRAEQSRTEQPRTEQPRTEQPRTEQLRTEPSCAEQPRAEQVRAERLRADQRRPEPLRSEPLRSEPRRADRTHPGRLGPGPLGTDRTHPGKPLPDPRPDTPCPEQPHPGVPRAEAGRAAATAPSAFTAPRPHSAPHTPHTPHQPPRRAASHPAEFTLLHEPVVSLTTGRIVSVAAQPRRRSTEGTLVDPYPAPVLAAGTDAPRHPAVPADYLRTPEEPDPGAEVARWTFEAAIEQAAERGRAGLAVPVVVRAAARRLMDRTLPGTSIEALLTRYGLPSGALVIELAGSDPHVPLEELERRLAALRRHGVRIALDGFGTGYAAFHTLRRLPVDWLKLDRVLIEGVVDSARLHKITGGLLRIASDLGLCSVADGVDRPEQAAALRTMGCTHAQGRAFSGPLDEYRLRRTLANGRYTVPREPAAAAVLTPAGAGAGAGAGAFAASAAGVAGIPGRSHVETPVPPP